MQRYYFHTEDGRSFRDEDGTELASDGDARVEAARVLGQLLNEDPARIWADDRLQITVANEAGSVLFTLKLVAAPGQDGETAATA